MFRDSGHRAIDAIKAIIVMVGVIGGFVVIVAAILGACVKLANYLG